VASGWLPVVLEADFQSAKADRAKTDSEASAPVDLPNGGRESNLGRAAHPWGASHAWFRYLGTNDFSLDDTSTERSGTSQTLACLSAQSSGSRCGDDFFTVPTIRFSVLYCFFVISHDRRRILHFNVTKHPTSLWIVQQLREAFPFESSPRFLIFDRDGKYGAEVPLAIRSLKVRPVRTSFESPWQNGVAERWVESCRHDLLDHIIAVNERHLKRLLSDYIRYYHEDRTHLGLP
jgi:transposase InsO family protein